MITDNIQEDDLKSIVETYVLASVPGYVYNLYKKNDFVIKLSHRISIDLINEFKAHCNVEIKYHTEIAYMYAIVSAILMKPYREIKDFLFWLQLNIFFEWFPYFTKLYFERDFELPINDVVKKKEI